MTRFHKDPSNIKESYNVSATTVYEERIKRLEQRMDNLSNYLQMLFLKGRTRVDRSAPVSSADVQPPDMLYDVVWSSDYLYIVVDDSGVLKWRRITLSTF
jgi:hypothetical protein